jgi:hypothetical protein
MQQHADKGLYVPMPADTESGWQSKKLGVEEFAGEFEIEVEGDSMLPENQVQRLEEANRMMTAFGQDELVDPVKVREYSLERYGVDDVKSWIVNKAASVPAEAMQLIVQALEEQGVDPVALEELIEGAVAMVEEQAQGGDPAMNGAQAAPSGV